MNQSTTGGIVELVRKVFIYSLTIQATMAALFALRWSTELSFGNALYYGIFHSVSLFNNAGFDLIGAISPPYSSLMPYVNDLTINTISMVEIFLGGIGFVVLSDLYEFPYRKRISFHSKVVLIASGWLIGLGMVVIFIFEFSNESTMGGLNVFEKSLTALFHSISPRSGGVNTLDIASLRQATQFVLIILMFIGAAPGSAGGGIKITTFVVLLGAVLAMIRGKQEIVILRHRIAGEQIYKAITITLCGLFLIIFSTMLLSTSEDRPLLEILFETTSAFGTAGMSMGHTPHLSDFGKIMISILMFVGRLGPLTLSYALAPDHEKDRFRYPEGNIRIG